MKPFLKSTISTFRIYSYEIGILFFSLLNILIMTYGTINLNSGTQNIESCAIGTTNINGTCQSNTCFCDNGTPAVNIFCGRNNSLTCYKCDEGFHTEYERAKQRSFNVEFKNKVCKENLCGCDHGSAKLGSNCSSHGAEDCEFCDEGYEKFGFDKFICIQQGQNLHLYTDNKKRQSKCHQDNPRFFHCHNNQLLNTHSDISLNYHSFHNSKHKTFVQPLPNPSYNSNP